MACQVSWPSQKDLGLSSITGLHKTTDLFTHAGFGGWVCCLHYPRFRDNGNNLRRAVKLVPPGAQRSGLTDRHLAKYWFLSRKLHLDEFGRRGFLQR